MKEIAQEIIQERLCQKTAYRELVILPQEELGKYIGDVLNSQTIDQMNRDIEGAVVSWVEKQNARGFGFKVIDFLWTVKEEGDALVFGKFPYILICLNTGIAKLHLHKGALH